MGPVGSQVVGIVQLVELAQPLGAVLAPCADGVGMAITASLVISDEAMGMKNTLGARRHLPGTGMSQSKGRTTSRTRNMAR